MPKYTEPTYAPLLIPPGNYRARITSLTWDYSKAGNEMLVATLKISGYSKNLKFHNVFFTDTPDRINMSNFFFKKFCQSFNLTPELINQQGFNLNSWIGAEGGVVVIHEDYNGNTIDKVKTTLTRKQYGFLNPFVDVKNGKQPQQPVQTVQQALQQPQQQMPQQMPQQQMPQQQMPQQPVQTVQQALQQPQQQMPQQMPQQQPQYFTNAQDPANPDPNNILPF